MDARQQYWDSAELVEAGEVQGVYFNIFGEEILQTGFSTKRDASKAIELAGRVLAVIVPDDKEE